MTDPVMVVLIKELSPILTAVFSGVAVVTTAVLMARANKSAKLLQSNSEALVEVHALTNRNFTEQKAKIAELELALKEALDALAVHTSTLANLKILETALKVRQEPPT